jgi:hypothetical protein
LVFNLSSLLITSTGLQCASSGTVWLVRLKFCLFSWCANASLLLNTSVFLTQDPRK